MPEIKLYNTRTRRLEPFVSLQADHVRMYTCGPTVYAPQHIGNLRSQLFADLVKRTLQTAGYRITHVINITDVGHLTDDASAGDDKLESAAKRSGRRAEDIANEYTRQWQQDRARVGCLEPDILCRATDHIPEQIALARTLEEKGFTYLIEDGLYFDTARFPRYAEFAQLHLEQETASRIGEVTGKRHPADFALWKHTAAGVKRQQEWDSPWGRGFPGWHIECSAMSSKYLGQQFDIHTGGVDHIKVHHTNEIAQSEAAFGVHPWVQMWMHGEFLTFDDVKMSKSQGNVLVLDDLMTKGFLPLSFRYFFLQAHYRQQQTFNEEAMAAADKGYRRLLQQAIAVRAATDTPNETRMQPHREAFYESMYDDLNAPRALAETWAVAHANTLSPADKKALFAAFEQILGLGLTTAELPAELMESDPRIDALVQAREAARHAKNWAEADRIRKQLQAEGITLVDSPTGPRWHRKVVKIA